MSIFEKFTQNGDQSGQSASIDTYVDIISHVLVSPSFLKQSQNAVAAMRASNGLPPVAGPIAFEHAYEQINGDHRGYLVLSHDLDEQESFFIMAPPGWWWFADSITPEVYDGMMELAVRKAGEENAHHAG